MAKGSIQPNDVLPWAVGAVAVAGLAYKFGLFDHDTRTDPRSVFPAEDVDAPPTLTNQAAQVIADSIFAAIYGDGTLWSGNTGEDEDAVIANLAQAMNDSDVLLISDKYGVRSGTWSLSGDLDLIGAVRQFLSPDDIAAINADWTTKGIQIQF